MGILVSIAAGAELAKTLLDVGEKLRQFFPSRAVVIQVHNHTDQTLRLVNHAHTSGVFGELPSQQIPPKTIDVYGSRRRGRPEGARGWVEYRVEGADASCRVQWSLRWRSWRSRSSSSSLSGSDAQRFEVTDIIGGSTSQGEARYELLVGSGGGASGGGQGQGGADQRVPRGPGNQGPPVNQN